jgi:DNA-binding transcriptional MerR regulator
MAITYSMGQLCKELNIENFNLRYIEKTTGIEIKRNDFGERIYTEQDVSKLKFIIELKNDGLNYKAIKKALEHQKEISVTESEDSTKDNSILIPDDKMQQFMGMIKNTIDESIENKVTSKLEVINNKLQNLENQNNDLKQALEKEQEKHFKELDLKLTKWRDQQEIVKNKPWYKKIFNK